MSIDADQPTISVVLHKRIERRNGVAQRVSGSKRRIDLTPYLGQSTRVTTRKSVREPAGSFSIVVPDQVAVGVGSVTDSLVGVVEPMDFVEIRMARKSFEYGGGDGYLPIIMRGFVSNVRRVETVINDKPRRDLVITGFDYGLIPKRYIIYPRANYQNGTDYLAAFPLHASGIDASYLEANEWMSKLVALMNGWLSRMVAFTQYTAAVGGSGFLPMIDLDASVQGAVSPYPMQQWSNSLAGLMNTYADLAWNELFIEDRYAGPTLVYRPIPFVDINGDSIQGVPFPLLRDLDQTPLVLTDAEMVSIDMSRSDTDVSNFFLVLPSASDLTDPSVSISAALSGQIGGSPLQSDNPDNDPDLYGLRPIEVQSTHIAPGYAGRKHLADQDEAERTDYQKSLSGWLADRRSTLRAMNEDNALFESGTLTVRGSELLRPGNYLTLKRGALVSRAYVHCVEHEFIPFQRYTSKLYVDRGTGFLVRTQQNGSPAYLEGARGPYS